MSRISVEDITKIARLARIKLDDEKIREYEASLNEIFQKIEILQKVDTKGVLPVHNIISDAMLMRQDVVDDGDIKDEILMNSKNCKYDYFVVPKVVE